MKIRCRVWIGEEEREKDSNPNWHGPVGESTYTVPVTHVECLRCGLQTESYGDHFGSEKRCLVLLRENCPKKQNNFYINEAY